MPRTQSTYQTLFAAKQRRALTGLLAETLREGTKLSMSLTDFAAGVAALGKTGADVEGVKLGDLFTGLIAAGGRTAAPSKSAARRGPARRRRAGRPGRPKKSLAEPTAPKKIAVVKKAVPRKAAAKKAVEAARPADDAGAKRRDAVVAVLKKGGDWMRTSDIFIGAKKQGALFKGVAPIHITQLLGKLVAEKPARVQKKGIRGASRYRAA